MFPIIIICNSVSHILYHSSEIYENMFLYSFKLGSINSVVEICKLNVQDKLPSNQESLMRFCLIEILTNESLSIKTELVKNSLLSENLIRHLRFDKRCLHGITKIFSPHNYKMGWIWAEHFNKKFHIFISTVGNNNIPLFFHLYIFWTCVNFFELLQIEINFTQKHFFSFY